ncbi:MAG TPA: GreA/GreB family elongation factor [Polyangiaceae bacterium]|nr:GreA/GreB family elongation factor [Polyangiaceae bacterium]
MNRFARDTKLVLVMPGVVDKKEILRLLRESVGADLATMSAAQRAVVDGATHEENRPENDKDTRALEQSYLARGQAQRVVELQDSLNKLKALELREFSAASAIGLGALVAVADGRESVHYFIAPAGGGMKVELSGVEVRVVTPQAPIARALLGKYEGDDLDVRTPQGVSECSITSVT